MSLTDFIYSVILAATAGGMWFLGFICGIDAAIQARQRAEALKDALDIERGRHNITMRHLEKAQKGGS